MADGVLGVGCAGYRVDLVGEVADGESGRRRHQRQGGAQCRVGVWRATQSTSFLSHTTIVADIATTAVELLTASLEYVDLFSRLIICTKPVNSLRADDLLGKVASLSLREHLLVAMS